MSKKTANQFSAIIAAHQETVAPPKTETTVENNKKEPGGKRANPNYSPVTVYIPTEIYTRAQFEMSRKGRKREMSELFTELLQEWLERQK